MYIQVYIVMHRYAVRRHARREFSYTYVCMYIQMIHIYDETRQLYVCYCLAKGKKRLRVRGSSIGVGEDEIRTENSGSTETYTRSIRTRLVVYLKQ